MSLSTSYREDRSSISKFKGFFLILNKFTSGITSGNLAQFNLFKTEYRQLEQTHEIPLYVAALALSLNLNINIQNKTSYIEKDLQSLALNPITHLIELEKTSKEYISAEELKKFISLENVLVPDSVQEESLFTRAFGASKLNKFKAQEAEFQAKRKLEALSYEEKILKEEALQEKEKKRKALYKIFNLRFDIAQDFF